MKKILSVLLGIIVVLLSGCHSIDAVDSDVVLSPAMKEDTVEESTTQNNNLVDIEYMIYAEPYCGENTMLTYTDGQSCQIAFKDASECDFSYSRRTEIGREKADDKRELLLGNRTVEVDYVRSFSNPLLTSTQETLQILGSFDDYRSKEMDGSITVRFRQADNELVFYSATDQRDVTGALTEQDAKALADAFLKEKYGDEFVTEYPYYEIVKTNDSFNKSITVGYTKYVCGYPTTDRVLVTYNMNGELKAFNAMTKGLFASVQHDITDEKISNAEDALLNTISSSWGVATKTLALDTDGRCYLHISAAKTSVENADSLEIAEFYINID